MPPPRLSAHTLGALILALAALASALIAAWSSWLEAIVADAFDFCGSRSR